MRQPRLRRNYSLIRAHQFTSLLRMPIRKLNQKLFRRFKWMSAAWSWTSFASRFLQQLCHRFAKIFPITYICNFEINKAAKFPLKFECKKFLANWSQCFAASCSENQCSRLLPYELWFPIAFIYCSASLIGACWETAAAEIFKPPKIFTQCLAPKTVIDKGQKTGHLFQVQT